jgi:hypothetical protein
LGVEFELNHQARTKQVTSNDSHITALCGTGAVT